MLFWNNDHSRGLAGHMPPATSTVQPANAQCCWLCHLSSDGLVESDCKHRAERHHSQQIYRSSEENRSIWVLFCIAIYRSSGHNPIFCPAVSVELPGVLMFWNPVSGHKVLCHALREDRDVLGVVNTGHHCDSQKISVFRCEYYRLQYRLSI